eukprot:SAG31_NODE_1589_length_7816_cov_5.732279_6_plen_153_part_00
MFVHISNIDDVTASFGTTDTLGMMDLLASYFAAVSDTIACHGGTLIEFVGDEVRLDVILNRSRWPCSWSIYWARSGARDLECSWRSSTTTRKVLGSSMWTVLTTHSAQWDSKRTGRSAPWASAEQMPIIASCSRNQYRNRLRWQPRLVSPTT